MMKNAILLHGRPPKAEYYDSTQPSCSNAHWFPWLQKQLLVHDIKADTPEVPFAFSPQWDLWVREVERFDITPETILVGHSAGGGFWIRYLTEHPEIRAGKVVLVAPWLNIGREDDIDFLDFDFNGDFLSRLSSLTVFASDNDAPEIRSSVEFLRGQLPKANFRDFHGYGHFCFNDLKTDAFPELLEEVLRADEFPRPE